MPRPPTSAAPRPRQWRSNTCATSSAGMPRPVSLHLDHRAPVDGGDPDRDRPAGRSELERVGQQVLDDLREPVAVGRHDHRREVARERDARAVRPAREQRERVAGDDRHVDRSAVERSVADSEAESVSRSATRPSSRSTSSCSDASRSAVGSRTPSTSASQLPRRIVSGVRSSWAISARSAVRACSWSSSVCAIPSNARASSPISPGAVPADARACDVAVLQGAGREGQPAQRGGQPARDGEPGDECEQDGDEPADEGDRDEPVAQAPFCCREPRPGDAEHDRADGATVHSRCARSTSSPLGPPGPRPRPLTAPAPSATGRDDGSLDVQDREAAAGLAGDAQGVRRVRAHPAARAVVGLPQPPRRRIGGGLALGRGQRRGLPRRAHDRPGRRRARRRRARRRRTPARCASRATGSAPRWARSQSRVMPSR